MCNMLLVQGKWEPQAFLYIFIHKHLVEFSFLRMFVEYLTKIYFNYV